MEGGGNLSWGKVSPLQLNPHDVCFHFYVMIKGIEKSLVIWSFQMPFKRILETISHFLVSRSYGGGTLYPGVKCPHPPPLNPHVCFHFYVMIKAWSFEVSECPSRGDWKQFLLSCPYEPCQWGGGGTIYPGVKCPPPTISHISSLWLSPPPPPPPIDYVHRDKIWKIVSSILLKGFQKLQITRLFSFPLS